MPRVVELTVPTTRTDDVVSRLRGLDDVVSLRLLRGISLEPPGDVVSCEVLDRGLAEVMRLADDVGLGEDPSVSVTTSRPQSMASATASGKVARDRSTSSWEEVQLTLGRESTMTGAKLLVMFISGVFAAVGLHSGALHVIVAAMLVAPAYEPLSHIAFGFVNRSHSARSGLYDLVTGYSSLALGGVLVALVATLAGTTPVAPDGGTYFESEVLVEYWTTTSWTSVLVAAGGGVAAALLIVLDRRVLATGVVVALALVPSLTLAVLELLSGDAGMAVRALLRWLLDVVLVLVGSSAVFALKRRTDRRRVR